MSINVSTIPLESVPLAMPPNITPPPAPVYRNFTLPDTGNYIPGINKLDGSVLVNFEESVRGVNTTRGFNPNGTRRQADDIAFEVRNSIYIIPHNTDSFILVESGAVGGALGPISIVLTYVSPNGIVDRNSLEIFQPQRQTGAPVTPDNPLVEESFLNASKSGGIHSVLFSDNSYFLGYEVQGHGNKYGIQLRYFNSDGRYDSTRDRLINLESTNLEIRSFFSGFSPAYSNGTFDIIVSAFNNTMTFNNFNQDGSNNTNPDVGNSGLTVDSGSVLLNDGTMYLMDSGASSIPLLRHFGTDKRHNSTRDYILTGMIGRAYIQPLRDGSFYVLGRTSGGFLGGNWTMYHFQANGTRTT